MPKDQSVPASALAIDLMPQAHDDQWMTTIYEAAGGIEVLERLAEATHRRCLADRELNHPFSHPDWDGPT